MGYQNVEDLLEGDLVYSRNEHRPDGLIEAKPIEKAFRRLAEVHHLHLRGPNGYLVTIRTTSEHPFYAFNKGWMPTKELTAEDWVLTENGDWAKVEEVFATGEMEIVYNLRVADWHTYFVGDEGWGWSVWAHNAYTDPNACQEIVSTLSNIYYLSSIDAQTISAKGSESGVNGDVLHRITKVPLLKLNETVTTEDELGTKRRNVREFIPILNDITIGYLQAGHIKDENGVPLYLGRNPNIPLHEQISANYAIQAAKLGLEWFARSIATNYKSWAIEDKGDAKRYLSPDRLIEIEVALDGHASPPEGPHITVSARKQSDGRMRIIRKVFIEGFVVSSKGVSNKFDYSGYASGAYTH